MRYESVYREILYKIIDEGYKGIFTQRKLGSTCRLSVSTVSHALKPLAEMNILEKYPMGFRVLDPWKLLLYWASIRRLNREVVYTCYVDMAIEEIETSLPPDSIPTAYTAFKIKYKSVPADYSEVLVYGRPANLLKRIECSRKRRMKPNLIVLRLDGHIEKFSIAPTCQIYVDLWNLNTWYANEYLKKLEEIINGVLARLGYREE